MRSLLLSEQEKNDLWNRLQHAFPEFVSDGNVDLAELLSQLSLHPMLPFLQSEPLLWEDEYEVPPMHHLIKGENLKTLRRLLTLKTKIKMIVIDPPYNTGKQFAYSDRWQSQAKDSFFRKHRLWLDMMGVRLQYARALLSDDGVIFICIDDHAIAQLRILCDAIFGASNFVQNFLWLHGKGKKNAHSRTMQQYILCYAKNKERLSPWKQRVVKTYTPTSNPDQDPRGPWFSGSISFSEKRSNPNHPNFFKVCSPTGIVWERQWLCSKKKIQELLSNNELYFGPKPDQNRVPRQKMFSFEDDIIPPNILDGCGTSRSAQKELDAILGEKQIFLYPKPVSLIRHLIELATEPGDWVLDFFAGSATTLQAAMELERLCICIQKQEPIGKKQKESLFDSVFSIAEHRIRTVIAKSESDLRVRVVHTCEKTGVVQFEQTMTKETT